MVQGTCSGAGKSTLVAALLQWAGILERLADEVEKALDIPAWISALSSGIVPEAG
jgi:hypothetical protein